MYPSIFNSFPVIRTASAKKSPFSRTEAHIFVSPGDAPAIIRQYVARMERQFNACQTPRSMYLSIFNSFRVIRCLSQCIGPKFAIFTTFLFPLGTYGTPFYYLIMNSWYVHITNYWIRDMYISRIGIHDMYISRIQIRDMYISRNPIRDMYISRIQVRRFTI